MLHWFDLGGYPTRGVGHQRDEWGFLIEFPRDADIRDHLIVSESDLHTMLAQVEDAKKESS